MKNGPHLSRLLDSPGTKGGPLAHFRRGPPKHPLVPGGETTRDQRAFGPGSWLHPGPKWGPLVPVPDGGWNWDQRLPPNISRRPLSPASSPTLGGFLDQSAAAAGRSPSSCPAPERRRVVVSGPEHRAAASSTTAPSTAASWTTCTALAPPYPARPWPS